MLELYDQTVRERSGGEMAAYLTRQEIPNQDFVLERIGVEGRRIMESIRAAAGSDSGAQPQSIKPRGIISNLYWLLRDAAFRREWMARRVLGKEYELLQLARFRKGGEIHLWMYDRYSLAKLLESVGFRDPTALGPKESQIPDWNEFHLDTEPDGQIYKPDSLYMEAFK
jgi:hypothetical protein